MLSSRFLVSLSLSLCPPLPLLCRFCLSLWAVLLRALLRVRTTARPQVLAKIRSPFCVNLHYSYQDASSVALVLTLMPGGDLACLLQSRYPSRGEGGKAHGDFERLPDGAVRFYVASMALGLQAIHAAGYVYRDLKPQNVLLDSNGQVRISDMGLTADITKGGIKQCSGTRGYWSPETIRKEAYRAQPDWWSLGESRGALGVDLSLSLLRPLNG